MWYGEGEEVSRFVDTSCIGDDGMRGGVDKGFVWADCEGGG